MRIFISLLLILWAEQTTNLGQKWSTIILCFWIGWLSYKRRN